MQRARAGPAALAALARPVAASPGMWNLYNATAGDTIFLHRFAFISHRDSITRIKSTASSVYRVACPNSLKYVIELCGGTGNMLDASPVCGYTPLGPIEIN